MKNLKNKLMTISLTAVILIGVSTANAGVIVIMKADSTGGTTQCTAAEPTLFERAGILLTDWTGIVLTDDASADVVDSNTACTAATPSTKGLLVSD